MELKKCERCGNFFAGLNNICNNCIQKENLDLSKLKNYIDETSYTEQEINNNLDNISYATGIPSKTLNRQLQNEIIFKDLNSKYFKKY